MSKFMFATGIENSYPTILGPDGKNFRVDEMAKTNHYSRWREDFSLVKGFNIHFLRYGPPLFSTFLGPKHYDWSFADDTFNFMHDLNIVPIVDLCHFGLPDWLGNFQNPDFPGYFAEYCGDFAARYPWVKYYTPVNEISIAALFSALYGWWNERKTDERSFVNAMKNLCKANVLGMHAILDKQPEALFIQSESSEYFHPEEPACVPIADFFNQRRFISLDLTYGNSVDVLIYEYLMDHGMTRAEYHWFFDNHVKSRCIMGNDYYVTNEHLVHKDGTTSASGEIFGYYVITHQYYDRYKLPVMHTETNIAQPNGEQWLMKEWQNMHRLRQDGVPILGFTWYSLTDQVDWDTALRENNGHINHLGLVDLDRKEQPVGTAYRKLIEQWRDILPTESHSLDISF